ncbi:MAG TPA: DapH/DapD/GlmU-related protein [Fimbriimonadaceae bacterium]|nr:DapH/DapD/GlmU-related protein [Fimbriimonadaceae bacterium]
MSKIQELADAGVVFLDPTQCYIESDVQIGRGTILEPGVVILGHTTIGANCRIGPFTRIDTCTIDDDCEVLMSHLRKAKMKKGSRCGPFANLRPGAVIGEEAKLGNFVEIKNAELGERASVSHLTYIGDAEVGAGTNIGAGTITCNYDGYDKHRTVIGSGAFVGSNSTLIAPVTIGDNAFVAAGSVITGDVPDDAMAIGRARQEVKEGWVTKWRNRRQRA